jgi:hypothetical protein
LLRSDPRTDKGIKKIAKIGLIIVLVMLAIPALSLLFLQNRQVQTWLSQYVAERLSEKLQASISLSSVNYSFFRRIQVKDLYIEDLYGDTLLYAGVTKLRIKQFRPESQGFSIRKLTIEDAFVNLVIDTANVVNISYFTDKLRKPHVPPEMKSRVQIASVDLVDSRFSLSRMGYTRDSGNVDFNDLHLFNLQVSVRDLEVFMDTVDMEVESVTCQDKSGFDFGQIHTMLSISKHHLHFDDLAVRTRESDLDIPALRFDFEDFSGFQHFAQEVKLYFSTRQSQLKMAELARFVPLPGGILDRITIDGTVSGKLSDLNGDDLLITFPSQSTLAFDFMMIGLPDLNNTFMDFSFRELNTSAKAVYNFLGPGRDSASNAAFPWINLGQLDFTGHFTGYPDHFVASGLLATDMGNVVMDLSFRPDSLRGIEFLGRLHTDDFRLGVFLEQERDLEQLDMDVYAGGSLYKGQIKADLKGTIDTLQLYNYAYSNITLDGSFTNNTFDGGFSVSDPNIKLDFKGRTDFSGEVPELRFTANVARARPYFLNLPQSDPNYFASFLIETDLTGRTIDELNGEIRLVNSLFEKTDAMVQLYDLTLTARNTPDASLLRIRSDLLDADVTGQYRLSTLPRSLKNLADHYLNVVPGKTPYYDTVNYFMFKADLKHINPVLDFFFPSISVSDQSRLSGTYDPRNTDLKIRGSFPTLSVAGNQWYNLDVYARSDPGKISAGYRSDSMTITGAYSLENQELSLVAENDTANMEIWWDNRSAPAFSGKISMNGTFQSDTIPDRGFMISLDPGIVVIDDQIWDIQAADLLVRKGFLSVDSFETNSIEKRIMAYGTISRENGQDFHLEVKNLNLAGLTRLTHANAELEGNVTGFINYRRSDDIPRVLTTLEVDSLYFNRQFLGRTGIDANWDDVGRAIRLRMQSEMNGVQSIESSGTFTPSSEVLDFDIRLSSFDLESLNPYTRGIVHDLGGEANVNLTLDGTLSAPDLNGYITFERGAGTFNYLNSRYEFSDRVRIYHNNLYFEDFQVFDPEGNMARVNGSVANTYLKNFYISLNIDADDFMFMNTRADDNEVFYGTIFASGNVAISGPADHIRLNVNASTGRNTTLFLPLYNASEVTTNDFLTFVREEDLVSKPVKSKTREVSGIELDLEVEVTHDAVVQLIFDPKVGDIIETSGNGDLRIMLTRADGFSIFGDVVLEQGDYLFTLQNVINKRFKIEPGGKIQFNGSPMNASIDLEAVYTLRAAPYNLYPDHDETRESLKRRIPVQCHLILQGELGSPTIRTGISMPTADAETKNLLENSTSTDEELMKQFLSLLVINNFYSVSGYGTQDIGARGNIAGVTASELLSNQLSNWLSQISDDFDIGVNYRPGDQITSDEVEVALSTQLLDDRIIISGNVDVGGQETNPSQGSNNPYIMGDFDVEFRVTDNVSIIAFNRARDELLFETAPYKQGVGISYREEFDDLSQLITRYREGLTNRKKKKKVTAPEMEQ